MGSGQSGLIPSGAEGVGDAEGLQDSTAIEPVHPYVALGEMGFPDVARAVRDPGPIEGPVALGQLVDGLGAPSAYHSRMPARQGGAEGTGRVTGR
jgi:hypothetical protein